MLGILIFGVSLADAQNLESWDVPPWHTPGTGCSNCTGYPVDAIFMAEITPSNSNEQLAGWQQSRLIAELLAEYLDLAANASVARLAIVGYNASYTWIVQDFIGVEVQPEKGLTYKEYVNIAQLTCIKIVHM